MESASKRLSKDEYFLEMLKLVAARSTCIRRAVGAIITDEDGHVLSTGYNGVPKGSDHCINNPCAGAADLPGNTSNCLAVHSEQNALLQCSDLPRAHTIYISCIPCFVCAKMICNTGIKKVICVETYADTRGMELLLQSGKYVEVDGVPKDECVYEGSYPVRKWYERKHNKVLPDHIHVLHKCDHPNCKNENHIFLGTKSDNSKDMFNKVRFKGGWCQPKLILEQVKEVKLSKEPTADLMKKYNVGKGVINRIRSGKTFKGVKVNG